MEDIAALSYKVDSSQVRRADKDLDQFAAANTNAAVSQKRMTKASQTQAVAVKGLTAAIRTAGTVMAAAFAGGAAVRTISEFQTSLSGVQAVTNATAAEMEILSAKARELGATTEFSAGQAADGLRFLGMAGFTAQEGVAALEDTLNLATASGMDLARSADIASNIMSAFGIAASDAASVTDVLAAAASSANTDVNQLGDAMRFVGPVAAAMGISVNDAAAAVGVLSDAGLQGSMAGTGLRRVLSSLANPTDDAADALERMGVALEDVNPATTDLTEIVDILAAAGIDAADALTIFGDRGGPAILALTSQADGLRELTSEMQDVDGTAERMANTMRDNLGGDIRTLVSTVQELILSLGDAGLTAVLRGAVQALTSIIRVVSAVARAFDHAASRAGEFIKSILGIQTASETQRIHEKAIKAVTFEMGEMARQADYLNGIISTGTFQTLDQAKAHLAAAEARKAEIEQIIRKRQEVALEEMGYGKLISRIEEARQILSTFRDTSNDIEDSTTALHQNYADAESVLASLLNQQQAMLASVREKNFLDEEDSKTYEKILANITSQEAILKSMTHESRLAAAEISKSAGSTEAWEAAMKRVRVEVSGIASIISQLGGGAISAAAKQTEISALRAGSSIREAAQAASEFKENLEIDAQVAGLESRYGILGKAVGAVVRGQAEYNRELDRTLEIERDAAIEREKEDAGGGGAVGSVGSARQSELEALITSLQTERETLEVWRMEQMELLAQFNESELAAIGGHAEAKLRIEQEYQEGLARLQEGERTRTLDVYSNMFGSMAALAKAGGEKTFGIWKAFSIAQATIDSYRAYTQVLADPFFIGRPWMRAIAAGTVLASGLAQVASIASTSLGGGGGGGGSSAPSSAAGTTQEAQPERIVRLNIEGPEFAREWAEQLAGQLFNATQDGTRVVIAR